MCRPSRTSSILQFLYLLLSVILHHLTVSFRCYSCCRANCSLCCESSSGFILRLEIFGHCFKWWVSDFTQRHTKAGSHSETNIFHRRQIIFIGNECKLYKMVEYDVSVSQANSTGRININQEHYWEILFMLQLSICHSAVRTLRLGLGTKTIWLRFGKLHDLV